MTQEYYRFPCGCEWPVVGPPPEGSDIPLLDIDDENFPFCPAVWEMLGRGDTKGVFQLESNLGRQWTKKLKPVIGEHLGALGAMLRPGCLRAVDDEGVSMTQHFCRRKNGEEETESYHESIDWILRPTYGCLIYQEQAMEIAKAVAGFSLQEADQLRKAIGKKLPEEMAKVKKMFLEGAAKQGKLDEKQAEEVFGWIEKSQRYSFNRSHAVGYGLTGYDTAYCKAHGPVNYFASWLRYGGEKADPLQEINELVQDGRLNDVPTLPPDLRTMEPHFQIDGQSVRFGMLDIKGVGDTSVPKLTEAKRRGEEDSGKPIGAWTWVDFLAFFTPWAPESLLPKLAKAGALDWMGLSRRKMLHELDLWADLTDKEREWVSERELLARGRKDPESLVAPLPPEPAAPTEGSAEWKKYKAALNARKKKAAKREKDIQALRQLTPFPNAASAVLAASRPRAEGGAAANKNRVSTMQGVAELLANPTSPLLDKPDQVAWDEEHLLGVAVTCSRVDAFDPGDVNCTCKEYASGRTGYLVLGVEVSQAREVKTKRGKAPGSKMAFLTLTDGTCLLTDVVCFPAEWKEFAKLLREGNCVYVQGERDEKQGTLIVKRVSQMER